MNKDFQIEILARALYVVLEDSQFGLSEVLEEAADPLLKQDKNYLEFKKEVFKWIKEKS